MGNLGFRTKLPKYGIGGALQKMQPGGVVQGPSHEEGGVPVVDESGMPIAEVEGEERIFSVEDTKALEQMSMQVMEASQQDPQAADQMATQLGYAVVKMLIGQEQANPSGGQAPQGQPSEEEMAAMMAQGGVGAGDVVQGDPYMEQPI